MYGSPGKHPIPSKQPEYCDRISCFVNGSLFTEVHPLCGDWTFLKAKDSPGLQTGIVDLWTCTQGAGGPLHVVFLWTGVVGLWTGMQGAGGPLRAVLFAISLPTGVEGVVVLKGVFDPQLSVTTGFESITSGQENKTC